MQVLLDFFRRYNYLFLFIVLEIVSITLLVQFNNYQGSAWLSASNSVTAKVNSTYAEAEAFVRLGSVNKQLTADNVRLQQENDELRRALQEVTRDTSYTERRIRARLDECTLIDAHVISNRIQPNTDNYLVIDRGSADGITTEMGVVASGGVVGIVYLTGPHHSLIIPVTHSRSNISCRVRGQDYFGYLQWDGLSTRTAHVNDVPRYAKVKKGHVIETSGYSSIFPPGIFVGRVESVKNSADGQGYRLDVVLGNDLGAIRDVFVVSNPVKAEIDTLRVHAAEEDAKVKL